MSGCAHWSYTAHCPLHSLHLLVGGSSGGGVDHVHRVAVEVGDHLEVVSQELEAGQPATEQVMDKLGQKAVAAATAEAPAGSDVPVTGQ